MRASSSNPIWPPLLRGFGNIQPSIRTGAVLSYRVTGRVRGRMKLPVNDPARKAIEPPNHGNPFEQ